ncbi:SecY-interacting protein [Thalassotalea piscium]|uniref:Protein Syd n=1 Tax=Thalassotalea piscium TaxID=1230533 RepID=A0A7X0NIQ3_9GAMM|nr:SecY-interacting protein [Thalassotalea piscium]MBB6544118.1 SecY interacting protein Syd [Thalassotalea piscium]
MLNSGLSSSLWLFSQNYVEAYKNQLNHLPLVEIDEQWPSSCIVSQFDEQFNTWLPHKVESTLSFENVEKALDVELHTDICQYFTTIFSDSIAANCEHGELSLLFAWSEEDFARLQENIIGHILMKRKLKQKITVFFAITDDENFILSIDNADGSVWVEGIGCEPHKKLADSLNEFIQQLTPFVYQGDHPK